MEKMDKKENKKDKLYYGFGMPNELIWGGHMAIGIFLIYLGYELIMKRKVPEYMVLTMIVLGALAFFYHIHIWFEHI